MLLHLSEHRQCGLILAFEDNRVLTDEVAAAIRTIRTKRGAGYEDLADVSVQRSISALEQGDVNITLAKLAELAQALEFDLVALLALCVSLQKSEPPEATLRRASAEIASFSSKGGIELLNTHIVDNKLVQRSRGKPGNTSNAAAVKKLKDAGYSQADAVKQLGLAKSTVHRYWQKA